MYENFVTMVLAIPEYLLGLFFRLEILYKTYDWTFYIFFIALYFSIGTKKAHLLSLYIYEVNDKGTAFCDRNETDFQIASIAGFIQLSI